MTEHIPEAGADRAPEEDYQTFALLLKLLSRARPIMDHTSWRQNPETVYAILILGVYIVA